jgi:hypothetical protein
MIFITNAPFNALKEKLFFMVVTVFLWSCKEKYIAPIVDDNISYLVVEGFINTGNDSTIIRLSRSIKVNGTNIPAAEKGAVVTVENSVAQSATLAEIKPGLYAISNISMDRSAQFRLKIRTVNGSEYMSDFVDSKVSPPLDSITYDFRNSSLNLQVNSTDPSGNSKYYQYSFIETYEYQSVLHSFYKIENGRIILRKFPKEDTYVCWRTTPSTTIGLMSTTALKEDRLDHSVLIRIPSNSQKISIEYSVLIKQNVLTRKGFEFWTALRKNTEQIGTIFDSQPSLLNGNIHSVSNPAEFVIGFISAGTISQKRVFVPKSKLPDDWRYIETGCKVDTVSADKILTPTNEFLPIDEYLKDGFPYGWFVSDYLPCIDCRTKGGTTTKPPFWH